MTGPGAAPGVGAMPAAEVHIDEELVRTLLRDQAPELAGRPLRPLATGWDNVLYRLGDDLVVRVPRRALSAPLILHEQRWLPALADRLPVRVPVPVVAGRPGAGFAWAWSVCPWIEGITAADVVPGGADLAEELGGFLGALHRPAPPQAPANPWRGGPLDGRDGSTLERLGRLAGQLGDAEGLRSLWHRLSALPRWEGDPVWLHGDLHPANIVVHPSGHGAGATLAGVVDFGDICAGDPATDLSVAWMLFDAGNREAFRVAAGGCDEDTWGRARGWALSLALAYLAHSADNPTMARIGRRVLAEVLAPV